MGLRGAHKGWEKIVLVLATAAPAIFCMCTPVRAFDGTSGAQGGQEIVRALQDCGAIDHDEKRLRCFDELALKNAPPKFSGKLGRKTTPFTINRPHVLRYRSKGVIFVLYVLNDKGKVVQNLHIGGGGEESYVIEQAGTYSLQVDGSAGWKIWLDPVEP